MNLETKDNVMKSWAWSIVLYAPETKRRLKAFAIWIWSRMGKISWLNKINQWGSSQKS